MGARFQILGCMGDSSPFFWFSGSQGRLEALVRHWTTFVPCGDVGGDQRVYYIAISRYSQQEDLSKR